MSNADNAIILKSHVDRYNLMVDYVKTIMVRNVDYGAIPGTQKPTLLKPGAEKLNSLFNLWPVFEAVDKKVDWENGLFFYQYQCKLVHRQTGETWGSGLGSCNSKESKYRYRYIASDKKPSKEEAAELKARGLGKWRKDGDKWVWVERIENDQIYDIVNTIDKMAQKRALIAATLIACNASEFFTQDVEDIPGFADAIDAEFTEVKETGQATTPPPPPPAPTNGKTEKPWTMPDFPEALPRMSYEEAALYKTKTGVFYTEVEPSELCYHAGSLIKTWKDDENAAQKLSAIREVLEKRQA